MDFYRLNDETGQLEVASQEVRLLKNEDGKSYWLKGLEYDILVMYDKPRGGLSVSPQLLEKVQGGYVYLAMWDVMNDYVLRNKSIGLISYATTNGIYLVDNGVWMGGSFRIHLRSVQLAGGGRSFHRIHGCSCVNQIGKKKQ